MKNNSILILSDINVNYGILKILNGVNLTIKKNQIVSLLGSNGAGKSTLINTVTGLLKPRKGQVIYKGKDISALQPYKIVEMGLVQVPEKRLLFPEMSVLDNLELGAYNSNARKKMKDTKEMVFGLFPILKDRRNQLAKTFSGGEQQMLTIGRSLMACPQLLILDEPSLGVAPKIVDILFESIIKIRKEGVTILLVEQNVYRSLGISDYAYILEEGKVSIEGNSRDLITNSYVKKAYIGM